MRKARVLLLVLAFVSLLFLVAGVFAQNPPANSAPSEGKAKIIFYYGRPIGLKDCLTQDGILIDGVNVHQIGQFHVWQTDLPPGTHTFLDETRMGKGDSATFVAGQTYVYEMIFHAKPGFLPSCSRFYNKFEEAKPNSKGYQKALALLGKPVIDETAPAQSAAAAPPPAVSNTVKLSIVSTPDAADIEVDGNFMGNTPSAIELAPGQHLIIVSKNGFKPWQRTIKLAPGDIKLNAQLQTDTAQR